MLSVTIYDDETKHMTKFNFPKTGEQLEEGKDLHVVEMENVSEWKEVKEHSSPMYKSLLYILMNSFGLAKGKEGKNDD